MNIHAVNPLSQMMLEPGPAGRGQVKAVPLARGFQNQEGIVRVYLVLQYLVYLGNRKTGIDEPNRAEAVYASAERLYRVVNLLIVLIVMELVRDEIYGHRDTPSLE